MALASAARRGVQLTGLGGMVAGSAKSHWETVNDDAKTTTASPGTIANLTGSTTFWTMAGPGVTRISAIRQRAAGTITGGATITVIGVDRMGEDGSPASGAKYRTILSGVALGTTTDITDGTVIYSTQSTNSDAGWDLLGDAAFLVAVTTGAAGSSTITIEAKLTN